MGNHSVIITSKKIEWDDSQFCSFDIVGTVNVKADSGATSCECISLAKKWLEKVGLWNSSDFEKHDFVYAGKVFEGLRS